MKRLRIAAVGVFVLLVLAGLARAVQEPVYRSYLAYQATRPLADTEVAALAKCQDPGWMGLSRVIEQDLDTRCSEVWLARTVATHLQDRELQWLRGVVADEGRTPRQRLRGSTALLLAGHEPTPDWPFLVTDPRAKSWKDYSEALYAGKLPKAPVDPVLRAILDRRRFLAGDLRPAARIGRWLHLVAAEPARLPEAERAKWSTYVLGLVGLGGGRLERAVERHRKRLGWQELPPAMVPVVAANGASCAKPGSADCLELAADLLAQTGEAVDGGSDPAEDPPPLATLPIPLWDVLYDRPLTVRAAAETLGEVGKWVAGGPPDARAERLLGSVAWPGAPADVARVRAGLAGDPIDVLPVRGGTPWAAALAALAIGQVAGVEVKVYAAGSGVRLVAGNVEALVGPCGAQVTPDASPSEPWPARAVLAQAAVEAAGAALRRGDHGRALRLAALAERLDAVGAEGAEQAVRAVAFSSPKPGWALGAEAAGLVGQLPLPPPTGADAARTARPQAWADLAMTWAGKPDPATCPAVLGP